jgi:hypothetical protein
VGIEVGAMQRELVKSQDQSGQILGAFAKLQKQPLALSHLSVHPSIHMEQLCCHWMDFHEILYLSILKKKISQEDSSFVKI